MLCYSMHKGGNRVKISNTSKRLKSIMNSRNLKQVDILRLAEPYCRKYDVKLGKNDLSQYVSGKVEPGQNKLSVLALALNVSEVWLMGYDVPMEKDMTVGERIKEARIKKGYTQDELAKLLGYKSRSSVNKIEVDGRDIPRSSIVKFAKVLGVKPSFLMGWEDEEQKINNIDISTHFKISSHERELVVAYREHPESQPVIDKILDIDKPKTFKVMTAARSADGRTEIRDIEMTAEEVEKLDNIPETDEQF